MTIPSSCLLERDGKGNASVLVVRGGEVHRAKIHVGIDNGLRVEVAKGLLDGDLVILQPDPSIPEGTKVQTELPKADSAAGPASKSAREIAATKCFASPYSPFKSSHASEMSRNYKRRRNRSCAWMRAWRIADVSQQGSAHDPADGVA